MDITGPQLGAEVQKARSQWSFIESVESQKGLPFGVLYAVGSRETNLTNEVGDFGHGHGVWQLDDRSHPIPKGFDQDVSLQAQTASEMLISYHNDTGDWVKAFNIYNSGSPDTSRTTHGDYGPDVNDRWQWVVANFSPGGGGTPGTGTSLAGCSTVGGGMWCARNGAFPGDCTVDGTCNVLYDCTNGTQQACSGSAADPGPGSGCQVNPAGVDDGCAASSGPGTSLAGCSAVGGGIWCARNGAFPGDCTVNGSCNVLYDCTNGTQQTCSGSATDPGAGSGCQVNPAGVDDTCAPSGAGGTSLAGCSAVGAGMWCARNNAFPGNCTVNATCNVLYDCTNGTQQTCSGSATDPGAGSGCQVNASGVDDTCAGSSGGGTSLAGCSAVGAGLWCARNSAFPGDCTANATCNILYDCTNGTQRACSGSTTDPGPGSGCQVNASGVDDSCQ